MVLKYSNMEEFVIVIASEYLYNSDDRYVCMIETNSSPDQNIQSFCKVNKLWIMHIEMSVLPLPRTGSLQNMNINKSKITENTNPIYT